ncbi:MAG: ClpP family protease [Lachnospiraceae bacterium]
MENQRNTQQEEQKMQEERIRETGQVMLEDNSCHHKIHLLSIIGEIEGHENLSSSQKSTKYEHILPQLAALEDDQSVDGMLVLLNTSGGDVEAGLAIAEMISTMSIPTVSLVLGGSHSIGVPLAVSTNYSFIVKSGTMLIHPVRMSGSVIGAPQTYDYFQRIQDRITRFIAEHSKSSQGRLEQMMMNRGQLTKDLGTILVGEEAVREGLIDEIGGIQEALQKLHQLIDSRRSKHI